MPSYLAWLLAANTVGWLGFWLLTLALNRRTPCLRADSFPPPTARPLVSILVPARNEAERSLEPSLRSMLAVDWEPLEVIAVDDRSTDETRSILERLAAEDPRLTVIAGVEPPDGWVGKVHALCQAQAVARGEWLLGTDADMLFAPAAVTAALAAAEALGADLVTLLPAITTRDLGVRLVLPVTLWMILQSYSPAMTNNPRDRRALGSGGFLMIRRAALEAAGGYAAVAHDVGDDVGLTAAVKRAGFRTWCADGATLVATPMYGNLRELFAGFAKSAWRGLECRWWFAAAVILLQLLGGGLLPLFALVLAAAALADPAWWPACGAALAAWAAMALCFEPAFARYGLARWHALSAPFGFAFMAAVLAESTRRGLLGRPIEWRGRPVPPGGGRATMGRERRAAADD